MMAQNWQIDCDLQTLMDHLRVMGLTFAARAELQQCDAILRVDWETLQAELTYRLGLPDDMLRRYIVDAVGRFMFEEPNAVGGWGTIYVKGEPYIDPPLSPATTAKATFLLRQFSIS